MRTLALTIGTSGMLILLLLAPVTSAMTANGGGLLGPSPGCATVTLDGLETGGVWTFAWTSSGCGGPGSGTVTGSWDPAVGGCIGDLCLTNPGAVPPGIVTFDYTNMVMLHSGSVTLLII